MDWSLMFVRHRLLLWRKALELSLQLSLSKKNKILNAQLFHQEIKGLCMKLYLHVTISQRFLVS
uniref:Uncharacterized protein n=1 Tax=Arundo donax TaxID=35708 RepID=A0A0A9FAZ9_ARUDO